MEARYDFVFNNQMIQKSKGLLDIYGVGLDVAGNLLYMSYNLADAEKATDGTYHLFGQPFAQFVKAEVDASYHYRIK
ncbi:MAG: hypothetical protein MZV63_27535 [Marinilabiliales bacterium]|nr:hypothetical protein [Marinilabiliales bacterium]